MVFGPGFIRLIGGMFDFLSSFVLMNLKLPPREPPAHVIAEYKHRDRWVKCSCGWEGASEGRLPSDPSPWKEHVAAGRIRR